MFLSVLVAIAASKTNLIGGKDYGRIKTIIKLPVVGTMYNAVLDRERFSDQDRERERGWQKVPGTGINRERE